MNSNDEIGQVSAAFNSVHRVAIQVATEQAALRKSIGDMFLNLARRSQSLIDRQLELIDDLERTEADPDALDNLFKLDHLATRMRRNAEDLIVLSGPSRPGAGASRCRWSTWSGPPWPRSRTTTGSSCCRSTTSGWPARRSATSSTCWPS